MKDEGYHHWGAEMPQFKEFWSYVHRLADVSDERCCRSGKCGAPFCTIRKCAKKRGLERCDQCEEFPCRRVNGIAEGYPTIIHDAERRKKIGDDKWVEEQEKRREAGFQYSDIRCNPYTVPFD